MNDKQIDEALEALNWFTTVTRAYLTYTHDDITKMKDMESTIRAALERQREGWKLVPVEPTGEMLWDGFPLLDDEDARRHYKALLAAAPEPDDD